MFMFVFCFTFAAQIEMIAEDALVPDPDDAELVFAAGTDDFVEQEFPIWLFYERVLDFFNFPKYLGTSDIHTLLRNARTWFSRRPFLNLVFSRWWNDKPWRIHFHLGRFNFFLILKFDDLALNGGIKSKFDFLFWFGYFFRLNLFLLFLHSLDFLFLGKLWRLYFIWLNLLFCLFIFRELFKFDLSHFIFDTLRLNFFKTLTQNNLLILNVFFFFLRFREGIMSFFLLFFQLYDYAFCGFDVIRSFQIEDNSLWKTLFDVNFVDFCVHGVEHINEVFIAVYANLIFILIQIGKRIVDRCLREVAFDDVS